MARMPLESIGDLEAEVLVLHVRLHRARRFQRLHERQFPVAVARDEVDVAAVPGRGPAGPDRIERHASGRAAGIVGLQDRPDTALARKRGGTYAGSLGNALWVTLVFIVGFLVTIPLWIVAPLAFIVPLLLYLPTCWPGLAESGDVERKRLGEGEKRSPLDRAGRAMG